MNEKETLKGVIDRFEDDCAVTEIVGETEPRNILLNLLPKGVKEGDHIHIETEDGRIVQVQIDADATRATVERIQDKLDRLQRGEHLIGDD